MAEFEARRDRTLRRNQTGLEETWLVQPRWRLGSKRPGLLGGDGPAPRWHRLDPTASGLGNRDLGGETAAARSAGTAGWSSDSSAAPPPGCGDSPLRIRPRRGRTTAAASSAPRTRGSMVAWRRPRATAAATLALDARRQPAARRSMGALVSPHCGAEAAPWGAHLGGSPGRGSHRAQWSRV